MSFFLEGECTDLAYQNTRDHPRGATYKAFVEELWERYKHLADPHFKEDARNHFLQRFWEMYLAVTLIEQGFDVKKHGPAGPEFFVDDTNGRIWFEAIAPGPGTGADQVPGLVPGVASLVPTEQILLRFTHAFEEKRKKYATDLAKGIVSAKDRYVVAINCRGIREAVYGDTLPYYVQAFLPIGPLTYTFNLGSDDPGASFYQHRPHLNKKSGAQVSTTSFLDESSTFCSAVLHSSVDCANRPEGLGGDFSLLFNPRAVQPLEESAFLWCERFKVESDELVRSEAQQRAPRDVRPAARAGRP